MTFLRTPILHLAAPLAGILLAAPALANTASDADAVGSRVAPGDYGLVRTDLTTEWIRLGTLDKHRVEHVDAEDGWQRIDIAECLGLFDERGVDEALPRGLLVLSDGQRFPGHPSLNAEADADAVAWTHPIFGRLQVPIDVVRFVQLTSETTEIDPGDEGAVLLANGDRLEGFIISLGDPISIEVEGAIVDVPLERAVAVALVTPDREPKGQRIWLRDGTVIDVDETTVGDDSTVRLTSRWLTSNAQQDQLQVGRIAGIRFRPGRLYALATIEPSRVEGPPNRYRVPWPWVEGQVAPLELHPIELRGPITVHYPLPAGTRRFAAEVRLPESSRRWGDFEFQVLDEGRVVFRAHLSNERPSATINVAIEGAELTIRMTEGRYGQIQDMVMLERAMLLVD